MGRTDRPVGVGVIGLNWGLGRCAALREVEEARLVAVAARSEATARKGGEQFGVDWHADYRELLRRDDIDLVAVYTPSGTHLDIAADAARAGKHVLTTKPLEVTLDRIDAAIAVCREAGVKLATEYMTRYGGDYYRAYRAIADGAPLTIQALKEALREMDGHSIRDSFRLIRTGKLPTYEKSLLSEDAKEGVRAFAEKRKANFQGR